VIIIIRLNDKLLYKKSVERLIYCEVYNICAVSILHSNILMIVEVYKTFIRVNDTKRLIYNNKIDV